MSMHSLDDDIQVPISSVGSPSPRDAVASWVPIRSLTRRHRQPITAHLLALPPQDRYLRFGYAASDQQIAHYVLGIDFEHDELFGIFNRRLELIAVAHLAYEAAPQFATRPALAEFGVSVLPHARGRGYGARLFEHAVIHARNRGTEQLYIQALSENTAMLSIARKAGATLERDGTESKAWLRLPADTVASQLGQMMETQAAEVNYQYKRHAIKLEQLIEAVGQVREKIAKTARSALK